MPNEDFGGYYPDGPAEPVAIDGYEIDLHVASQIDAFDDRDEIAIHVDLSAYYSGEGGAGYIQLPTGKELTLNLPTGHTLEAELDGVQFEERMVTLWFKPV